MSDQLPTIYPTPDASPGFLLWQVSNLWQRRQRMVLEPLGLTHAQFVLLASLCWLKRDAEPLTQAQLAQHIRLDAMLTSDVLRALEGKGLIVRAPHPHDSRAKALAPTDAGRVLAAEALTLVEAVDQDFFAVLGPNATAATALLRHLRDSHA